MTRQKTVKKAIDSLSDVLDAVSGLAKDDQLWVFRAALDKLALSVGGFDGRDSSAHESDHAGGNGTGSRPRGGGGGSPSASEFYRSKRPKTDAQKIACLAYYLTHHKNTHEFKTADLQVTETESKAPKITNLPRAVDNASRSARVLTSTTAGLKQITTHGEDVVNALPDQEAVKEVLRAQKPTKRRKRKSNKKVK